METKSPTEIALAIGAPTDNLLGTQDWASPLHPDLIVSQLHYGIAGEAVAFRVKNIKTGGSISKLPEENSPGDVDAVHTAMVAIHQKVSLEILPTVYAAISDLDPSSQIVRGLNVGGKEMIADLINGQIVNVREPAVAPIISLGQDGALRVDISNMPPEHKILISAALSKVAPSIVSNLALPTDSAATG